MTEQKSRNLPYEHPIYFDLLANSTLSIVGESRKPIILEEEISPGLFGTGKISYGLPYPVETPFFNTALYVTPTAELANIDDLNAFAKDVLSDYAYLPLHGIQFRKSDNRMIFPRISLYHSPGAVKVIHPVTAMAVVDSQGIELKCLEVVEGSKLDSQKIDVNTNTNIYFFPNASVAEAIRKDKVSWGSNDHRKGTEIGYLREELAQYDSSLGPEMKGMQWLKNFFNN